MKKQSEIRVSPIRDPVRINVILPRDSLKILKARAAYHDTTVNEIIRTLVSDYAQTETVADDTQDGGAMDEGLAATRDVPHW